MDEERSVIIDDQELPDIPDNEENVASQVPEQPIAAHVSSRQT